MRYEPGTEKVAMMGGQYTTTIQPVMLTEDPQLKRSRKVLMIMLSICLVLCLVNTTVWIVNRTGNPQGRVSLGLPILSILFYGFGLLVAYKHSETGLRVFAWLSVIMLIGMGILLGFFLIGFLAGLALASIALGALNSIDTESFANSIAVNSTVLTSDEKAAIKGAVVGFSAYVFIYFLIYGSIFIFTIIMVTYAFRLARQIESKKNLIIRQI